MAVFAPVAQASTATGSCVKPGEKFNKLEHGALQVSRLLQTPPWEKGSGFKHYFCSPTYGKRVYVGDYGVTPDGGVGIFVHAESRRFVAIVTGTSGNGGFESDGLVRVVDLKKGRIVTSVGGTKIGSAFVVRRLIMNAEGWIGWTAEEYRDEEGDGRTVEVLSTKPGGSARQLAVGKAIDPIFLRFAKDNRTVIWADPFGSAPWAVRGVRSPTAKSPTGRCLKAGEKIYFKNAGTVLIKRPMTGGSWKQGFELIGCSDRTKKRHVVGKFGIQAGDAISGGPTKYELANKSVNSRFAAIVSRSSSKDSRQNYDRIRVFDLIQGRFISSDKTATQNENSGVAPGVTRVQLATDGSVAWIVRLGPKGGSGTIMFAVSVRDASSARLLAQSATIDPLFLRFSDYRDAPVGVRWAQKVGSGVAH